MNYFLDTDFEADKMEKVFEFLEIIMSMLRWRMMIQTTMKLF